MALLVPKSIEEQAWKKLDAKRAYAVRFNADEEIYLRLGPSRGVYLAIEQSSQVGIVVNDVSYNDGELNLIGQIDPNNSTVIGRTVESSIKIMHAIISRKHTELRAEGNILIVQDFGSTNGTFCYSKNIFFDIDAYVKEHPPDKAWEGTLDQIHEDFGVGLDNFLKRYIANKK